MNKEWYKNYGDINKPYNETTDNEIKILYQNIDKCCDEIKDGHLTVSCDIEDSKDKVDINSIFCDNGIVVNLINIRETDEEATIKGIPVNTATWFLFNNGSAYRFYDSHGHWDFSQDNPDNYGELGGRYAYLRDKLGDSKEPHILTYIDSKNDKLRDEVNSECANTYKQAITNLCNRYQEYKNWVQNDKYDYNDKIINNSNDNILNSSELNKLNDEKEVYKILDEYYDDKSIKIK